jgi:hypothetical protein
MRSGLMHTIIHEIGHAVHYHNARGRFYNLNFAFFKGKAEGGRTYQEIAETEVSGYGNNPREIADPRLLWRLAHRPLWVAGIVAARLSAVLHVLALSFGPITR